MADSGKPLTGFCAGTASAYAFIFLLLVSTNLYAASEETLPVEPEAVVTTAPSKNAEPSSPAAQSPAPVPAASQANSRARTGKSTRPRWSDLTPAQQQALAPLASEWNTLEPLRKTKWLEIGNKYASMKPDEQQRVQERMREWVKLTPAQRQLARESYLRASTLDPEQKSARWEQYQQLSDEQKKKLAADASAKKPVAALPSPSQGATKTVPPIKAVPKPVIEKSLTPHAVNQASRQAGNPSETKQ